MITTIIVVAIDGRSAILGAHEQRVGFLLLRKRSRRIKVKGKKHHVSTQRPTGKSLSGDRATKSSSYLSPVPRSFQLIDPSFLQNREIYFIRVYSASRAPGPAASHALYIRTRTIKTISFAFPLFFSLALCVLRDRRDSK